MANLICDAASRNFFWFVGLGHFSCYMGELMERRKRQPGVARFMVEVFAAASFCTMEGVEGGN